MRDFQSIYDYVLSRFGDARIIDEHLALPKTSAELVAVEDARYLSDMCRRIFRAGLKHSLVDKKWPAFEKAFFGFNPARVAMMSDDELDELMANRELIRHWGKLKSVPVNAAMVLDISQQYGSVGQWLADWPDSDIVGLWTYLKKQGAQLGGNSGAYFLRMAGRDTFVLTDDVVAALVSQAIIDKRPTSQRDLAKVQAAFNTWKQQSGRPLCQISRLLSMTVNH
jgi:3-methyladenine DNA glycosylase Tag